MVARRRPEHADQTRGRRLIRGKGTKQPVGYRPQVGALGLKLFHQTVMFIHWIHFFFLVCDEEG